jgi:hypothetical protein
MTSDLDIDRSALVLIRRYGELATLQAEIRADELLERGDKVGVAVWKRISWAIERLQAQLPPAGVAVH